MSAARPCPICRDAPVPPVTLVPCGHRLCGPCIQVMRTRAGTRDQFRRAGFRCPECRVLAETYVVSVAERAAATLSAADQVQSDAFMQDYMDGAPTAAPATGQEMQAIYDDSDSDGYSDSDDLIPLLVVVGPHISVASQPRLAGPRHSQRQIVSRHVDALEARVPTDLRMWDDTDESDTEAVAVHRHTLSMAGRPSSEVYRVFAERMGRRGVFVRETLSGLAIWLPADRRAQFLAG